MGQRMGVKPLALRRRRGTIGRRRRFGSMYRYGIHYVSTCRLGIMQLHRLGYCLVSLRI
jgi:hypothetical protein